MHADRERRNQGFRNQPLQPHQETDLITPLLTRLTELAVQLHTLSLRTESLTFRDPQLERLSADFDQAHARAVDLGIPLDTQFQLDLAGHRYAVSLIEDGLEYRLVS